MTRKGHVTLVETREERIRCSREREARDQADQKQTERERERERGWQGETLRHGVQACVYLPLSVT